MATIGYKKIEKQGNKVYKKETKQRGKTTGEVMTQRYYNHTETAQSSRP